jgi:hypothetical protein
MHIILTSCPCRQTRDALVVLLGVEGGKQLLLACQSVHALLVRAQNGLDGLTEGRQERCVKGRTN